MKKVFTALTIGAFSLAFSQGVNISKIHRAYIVQDENNFAYVASSKDDSPAKMQAQIDRIKAKETKRPYTQFPLLPGSDLPTFKGGNQGFINAVLDKLDRSAVQGSGLYSTNVTFSIDENGKVSDVKATGTNETLNLATILAIYEVKQGFTPAQYKGKNISTVINMEIPVQL